jgi:hypothetical protein
MDELIFNLLSPSTGKSSKDLYELDKLQTWMMKTVAPSYVQIYML